MILHQSFYRFSLGAEQSIPVPGDVAVVFVHAGSASLGQKPLIAGEGSFATAADRVTAHAASAVVVFALSETQPEDSVDTRPIEVEPPFLVRLDEVIFPPGAIAYRHVHPGAGFRHLRWGRLTLDAGDHVFTAEPGDIWHEGVNSPVEATAAKEIEETRFVRSQVLPVALEGKRSIQYLEPETADTPRLQSTQRHFDQRVETWPHGLAG